MKRLIDWHLKTWKSSKKRKPVLLKGARQIGKTYAVRQLGKKFENFVEINFELLPQAKDIFEQDLVPDRIIRDLNLLTKTKIQAGKTLLFFDEIQAAPQAILALRYFYEHMPDLHVIAAGSLIDFAIEQVGMPVGRVNMLYVYPLSFIEFLAATGNTRFIEVILNEEPLSSVIHDKLLNILGEYMAIGGMPEAVAAFRETGDPRAGYEAQKSLIETYQLDFPKYAKKHQLPYLDTLFRQIPHCIGKQLKYSSINSDYKKREVAPCFDLLRRANVVHQITHTAGNGLPLGAEAKLDKFKAISIDVGITQALLGLDLEAWFLNPDKDLVNRGPIAEALVGQELLAYSSPSTKTDLYFWKREASGSLAEIDYLHNINNTIIPIEVKSGAGSTLRSLHQFLQTHDKVKNAIRFWSGSYEQFDHIHSKPLYATASLAHHDQAEALRSLL